MSKKDYIEIAAILNCAHRTFTEHAAINQIQAELVTTFARDNPAFNPERFRTACVVNTIYQVQS